LWRDHKRSRGGNQHLIGSFALGIFGAEEQSEEEKEEDDAVEVRDSMTRFLGTHSRRD